MNDGGMKKLLMAHGMLILMQWYHTFLNIWDIELHDENHEETLSLQVGIMAKI